MNYDYEIWRDLEDRQRDIYDRTIDNIEYWQQSNEGRNDDNKRNRVD